MKINIQVESEYEIDEEIYYITKIGKIQKGKIASIYFFYDVLKHEPSFSYGIGELTESTSEHKIFKKDTLLSEMYDKI